MDAKWRMVEAMNPSSRGRKTPKQEVGFLEHVLEQFHQKQPTKIHQSPYRLEFGGLFRMYISIESKELRRRCEKAL